MIVSIPALPGEFDGDTSPVALAAWGRYQALPLSSLTSQEYNEQDAFTAGYDAASRSLSAPSGDDREALDELQDLIDDTAKPSKYPQVGLSNPREVAEAILSRFSLPEPAEVEWEYGIQAGFSCEPVEECLTEAQIAEVRAMGWQILRRRPGIEPGAWVPVNGTEQ